MVRLLIGIILAILIIAAGGLFFIDSQNKIKEKTRLAQITPTSTPVPQMADNIQENFALYKSDNYSLYHHPDMQVRSEGNGIMAFVLIGPTQKGETELYDGINFTVLTGEYTQNSFREFVDSEVGKLKEDGTSSVTQGVLSVSIGDKDGFEFMSRGLGEFRNIYFDKGNGEFVHVVILLEDPTNAGFEKIVEQMLQSLTF